MQPRRPAGQTSHRQLGAFGPRADDQPSLAAAAGDLDRPARRRRNTVRGLPPWRLDPGERLRPVVDGLEVVGRLIDPQLVAVRRGEHMDRRVPRGERVDGERIVGPHADLEVAVAVGGHLVDPIVDAASGAGRPHAAAEAVGVENGPAGLVVGQAEIGEPLVDLPIGQLGAAADAAGAEDRQLIGRLIPVPVGQVDDAAADVAAGQVGVAAGHRGRDHREQVVVAKDEVAVKRIDLFAAWRVGLEVARRELAELDRIGIEKQRREQQDRHDERLREEG